VNGTVVPGTEIDTVTVEIDNAIIRHFSEFLYSSPNKAIEELASNGFDAFAESVFVYLPGEHVHERVLVWDDGISMDVEGLKKLWWIARSPKGSDSHRFIERDGKRRLLIGKFGIGKLASYAVGRTVSHFCKSDGRFLRVGISYDDMPPADESAPPKKIEAPILEFTEDEARALVTELFDGVEEPDALATMFSKPTWTIAVIDGLREEKKLYPGRLRWILGNGMPLRPDFSVFVNDIEVEPGLDTLTAQTWNLSEARLQKSISAAWKEAVDNGEVEGDIAFGVSAGTPNTAAGTPTVQLPNLGEVTATVRLFDVSALRAEKIRELRSHGFFVIVLGRLLNPDDAELYLSPPSYGSFYRSQFVVTADQLDNVLLADREKIDEYTPQRAELAVLQVGLYRAARAYHESRDEDRADAARPEGLLPVSSRRYFRGPLAALTLRHLDRLDGETPAREVEIQGEARDVADPLAVLEPGSFVINQNHPFYAALRSTLGESRLANRLMKVIDVMSVSESLFEGYLSDLGVPDDTIEEILGWRDGLLRTLGASLRRSSVDIRGRLQEMSYAGRSDFEAAIAEVFSAMGFEATHKGASSEEDILVVAPIGTDEFSLVVDAKSSTSPVPNDEAEVDVTAAHRDAVGARTALVIAREFVGFKKARTDGKPPAIIDACRAVGGVSIVTTEALIALLDANDEAAFPLNELATVLEHLESPEAKLNRIRGFSNPTQIIEWRRLLDQIWEKQQNEASGDVVAYRQLWQTEWREQFTIEEFILIIASLESLAGGLIVHEPSQLQVRLVQSPEIISERIVAGASWETE